MTTSPKLQAPTRLERLGQYLASDPENVTLLKDYAREAWGAREGRASIQALRKLQGLEALDAEHAALLGRVLVAEGDPASAIAELGGALRLWPQSVLLSFELARSRFVAGEHQAALAQLPASSDDPALDAAIAALRVRLLHHAGRLQEAVEVVARFDAAPPMPVGVESALLPVLLDLGRTEEAVRRAERLASVADDAVPYEACEPLAIAALGEQRVTRSRQWLERALRMRRDDGRIWILSALTHLQAGETSAAGEAIDRAVELMPDHAESHLIRGWVLLLAEDIAGARSAFEQGIEASPELAEGHGSLAVVEAMQGRGAQADALVRKALLLDKQCASAQYAQMVRRGESPVRIQEFARLVLVRARLRPRPQ